MRPPRRGKVFASAERRIELDERRQLTTATAVANELGQMKGALMKLGQMASYLDEGLPEPMRMALAQLRTGAPPMSPELAAGVIEAELGMRPADLFLEWDPQPIAAASIGQVHRAIAVDPDTGVERPVAVKVQYPGVDAAIEADLRNADILGTILKQGFGGLEPDEMVAEIKERLIEELDYRREARNQIEFAAFYRDHPYIHIPEVVPELSTGRVLTSELVIGHTWDELLTWDQRERDLAGETIFRFVFRSLYRMRAFNGDPHPGNYLFHGDGRVTFLDFGLVKHFTPDEMTDVRGDGEGGRGRPRRRRVPVDRRTSRDAAPGAPVATDAVGEYFQQFYEPVRVDREMTWSGAYASSIVRHTFDRTSPISQYATVPRAFVFIQRINLGLYALLGELRSTGNYRRIAEELWPFVDGPPSSPIGEAEAQWLARG